MIFGKKFLVIVILFYFLVLFQTSFLIRFDFFSGQLFHWLGNLAFIGVLLLNFFENPREKSGILAAAWAGFLLDIFSSQLIGFYILVLIGLAIFIKIIVKQYVRSFTFY